MREPVPSKQKTAAIGCRFMGIFPIYKSTPVGRLIQGTNWPVIGGSRFAAAGVA
jgi:hypothetical protein